eukprot:292032-Heterocapsa_arctica.AAC.1
MKSPCWWQPWLGLRASPGLQATPGLQQSGCGRGGSSEADHGADLPQVSLFFSPRTRPSR